MANFNKAVDFLIVNEGTTLFEDPETGECSKFGISLRWLQQIQPTATPDTIRNLTRNQAIDLYETYWWIHPHLDQIPSDPVATKLLDACVNMGAVTAIKIFQNTLNEPIDNLNQHIDVDGLIGPKVIAAVQAEMALAEGVGPLLDAFAVNLIDHYKQIVQKNPALAKNLAGWEARAEKIPALV